MKNWKVLAEIRNKKQEARREEIVEVLLKNRGIKTKKQTQEFFESKIPVDFFQNLISKKDLSLAAKRIKKAIDKKEPIVIFGDYDCDGICGTAILWETLNNLGANVKPYIPERADGYGLSQEGIDNLVNNKQLTIPAKSAIGGHGGNNSLLITVDNGITANEAINYASSLGIDVVVTDHHLPQKELPKAFATLHSLELSGAAVAWLLSQSLISHFPPPTSLPASRCEARQAGHLPFLDLVALATVADLIPLIGLSRTLVKIGLKELNQTQNLGLESLISEVGLIQNQIETYHLGWILGPRINAAGRLGSAMDSLRLLCIKDIYWAKKLAQKLSSFNQKRQKLSEDLFIHTIQKVQKDKLSKLIFISDPSYNEGIIGLAASKLVEKFYRPAIVGAEKGDIIKASARSIPSFNIVEAIAKNKNLLEDFGGHPMAAGLTVKKKNFAALKRELENFAADTLTEEDLTPFFKIDCEVRLSDLDWELFEKLSRFEPFGIGNPRPVFLTTGLRLTSVRAVGNDQKHLKLRLDDIKTRKIEKAEADIPLSPPVFDGIGFNLGFWGDKLKEGDIIDLIYSLDKNVWNGRTTLQMKVKDIKISNFWISLTSNLLWKMAIGTPRRWP